MQHVFAKVFYTCLSASPGTRVVSEIHVQLMYAPVIVCASHECYALQACTQERGLITFGHASTHVIPPVPHVIAQVSMHMHEPSRFSPTLLCVVKQGLRGCSMLSGCFAHQHSLQR